MDASDTPVLESRLSWGIYFAPIVLVGGAAAMLIAWMVLGVAGDATAEGFIGPLLLVLGVISLALAGVWVWGAQRSRLTISANRLSIVPHLTRSRSVSLSTLAMVDVRQLPGSVARRLVLVDADRQQVEIGLTAWQHEAEIFRHILEAAGRTGANVTPQARAAIASTPGTAPGSE